MLRPSISEMTEHGVAFKVLVITMLAFTLGGRFAVNNSFARPGIALLFAQCFV